MERQEWLIALNCTSCHWSALFDHAGISEWLRRAGRLHANSDATPDVVRELALALVPQQPCPQCGAGLAARVVNDDEFDWPEAPRCQACGRAIPPERLEIFPGATLCVVCQGREERGETTPTGEFCPRCGAPLVMRPGSGAGIHRYVLACSASPPCRL